VKWAKGENPFGRIGALIIAAVAATLFAFLNIGLAATALMAFIGCLVMLVVGVIFACLFIIPGRARQWGMNWIEALLGLVMQSVAAMLVFGVALSLLTAVFSLSQTLGWLPVTGLALLVLIAAFRLRQLLESLTTMMRPGVGSMMMGSFARRGAVGAVRGVMTAIRGRGSAPAPSDRSKAGEGTAGKADSGGERVENSRIYRTAPVPGSGRQQGQGESDTERRPLPVSRSGDPARPGVNGSAGKRPTGRHDSDRRGGVSSPVSAGTQSTTGRQSHDIYQGGTFEQSKPGPDATRNSTDRSSGRHAKASAMAAQLRQGRHEPRRQGGHEPRRQVQSASLREGPAKAPREVGKPTQSQPRRFREYSAARSSGPTGNRPSGGR
jgi:hypothetical protein